MNDLSSLKYCPDDVQRLFEEHYNNIFTTGTRNHHECDICETIEKTIRMMGFKINYAFDQKSSQYIDV